MYSETIEINGIVTLHVRAQENQECLPKSFLLQKIIFGVITATVLIGLMMLLLWRVLATMKDIRELARFKEAELMEMVSTQDTARTSAKLLAIFIPT